MCRLSVFLPALEGFIFERGLRLRRDSTLSEAMCRLSVFLPSLEGFALKALAGRQGFEPRFYGSEPHVLPLDDLPVREGERLV
jgi:hypothetical protein